MNQEEVKNYIRENLKIKIERGTRYGYGWTVELSLEDEIISSSEVITGYYEY